MNLIDKATDEVMPRVLLDSFLYANSDEKSNVQDREILLLPRRVLKVRKKKYLNQESRTWFIDGLTIRRGTGLEEDTRRSEDGLVSGRRSVIVKEEGKYYRIKGAAPKLKIRDERIGGCEPLEAFMEAYQALDLQKSYYKYYTAIRPAYLEMWFNPGHKQNINELREFLRKEKTYIFDERKTLDQVHQELLTFLKNSFMPHCMFSAGYRINGDTRLDEIIFELTKQDLKGERKRTRDELLESLCFSAGAAKAYMTLSGNAWSDDFEYTNNHIGNFVVSNHSGHILTDFTDLGMFKYEKSDRGAFLRHTELELEALQDDFNEEWTFSLPVPVRFRFFDQDIRERCFLALATGYKVALNHHQRISKEIWLINRPEKTLVPNKIHITAQEFKDTLKYITGTTEGL